MRVYELAKKLGMENRELIPELKRMGITVASHSSALDEATVERVLAQLSPKARTGAGDEAAGREERKGPSAKKAGSLAKAGARDGGKGAAKPAPVEAPPKADKKRILIKRKKTDEEIAAEGVVRTGGPAEPAPMSSLGPPEAAPHPIAPPAGAPTLEPAAPAAPPAPVGEAVKVEREPPAPAAPPAIGRPIPAEPGAAVRTVSAAGGPGPALAGETEAQRLEREKKKGLLPVQPVEDAAALKDKLKKVRKPGRARTGEEEVKFREDAARWQDLRAIPVHRREDRSRHVQTAAPAEITKPRKKVIKLTPGLTVKEFAELVGQRPADVIRKLMEIGQLLTLNQPMNLDAGLLIAEGLGLKAEVAAEKEGEELLEEAVEWAEE